MNATKPAFTTQQADELVELLGYTDAAVDYEQNELGHVYTLENGCRLVIKSDGTHELFTDDAS